MKKLRFAVVLMTLSAAALVPAIKFFRERSEGLSIEERGHALEVSLEKRLTLSSTEEQILEPLKLRDIHAWRASFSQDDVGSPSVNRDSSGFYNREALELFERRKQQGLQWKDSMSPPLNVKGHDEGDEGVIITWDHNPRNAVVLLATEADPLLTFEYRIYRWLPDSRPEELTVLSSDVQTYSDRNLPARAQKFRYSVMASVSGQFNQEATLLESRRSETIEVVTRERFEVKVVKATAGGVIVNVTLTGPGARRSHEFFVKDGESIGRSAVSGSKDVDFSTGLVLTEIREVPEERQIQLDRPVFEPDGRRQVDPDSGDPVFEKTRAFVRVTRIEVDCLTPSGSIRTFSGAPGPPEIIR